MVDPVDPDDVGTWPRELRDALAEYVADVDPSGTCADDVRVPISDEHVMALLGGRPLRTYHATRLLPHEVESVRSDGLRALTPEHVDQRIIGALGAGAVTSEEAERFRSQTVYATGFDGVRTGQVCAVLGLTAFSEEWRGVWSLLATWGGEAIYMHADAEAQARFRSLGSPSIVALDLPLTAASWLMAPGLGQALAGHLAGLLSRGADVHYKSSVAASAVMGVWQPGAPEYDRYPDLPRE